MPRGARRLPDACVERLRAADLILHGGDLSTLEVLDELRALGAPAHTMLVLEIDAGEIRPELVVVDP